ncbi:MAG TPA: hypothetical protein VHB69_03780 [Mycobacteriales bacterium]|nr:hypothetical protein [Mycobacteriales bacterium]
MSESLPGAGASAATRQSAPWLVVRGGISVAVVAAGVVVAVTRGSSPVASAATILRDPRGATVRTASGATHAATDGEVITDGEVVMTGAKGVADLDTRGRDVLLSGGAAVEVVNGERQTLKTGTAIVDARTGPGLLLDVTGDTVSVPGGSATEAARGVSVRVGSLVGPASITSTTGRHLAVPRLYQATFSGDALPSAVAPLHLTDSDDETRVIPHVVADDLSLQSLARGIDTTGRSTAHVIEASWTGVQQPVPDAHSPSERVLPVLIADATRGGAPQQRYDDAVNWRAQGGSWGVVLHLLNGTAATVETTLASLQKASQPAGQVGTVITVGAPGVTGTPTGPSAIATPPMIGSGGPTFPTAPVTPSSPATPPATPSIPPNLLGGLIDTLQSVIDGVLNLLPHDPSSSASATASKVSKGAASVTSSSARSGPASAGASPSGKSQVRATPSPTPTSNGLLGDLLGGLLGQR